MTIDDFIKIKVRKKFRLNDNSEVKVLIFAVPGDDVQIQVSWVVPGSGFTSIRYYNGWNQLVSDMEKPV